MSIILLILFGWILNQMEWNGTFMWDSLGIDLIQSGNVAIFKTKTIIHVTMQRNRGPVIDWFSLVVSVSVCGLIEKLSLSKMPFEDNTVISESTKSLYICIFQNLL